MAFERTRVLLKKRKASKLLNNACMALDRGAYAEAVALCAEAAAKAGADCDRSIAFRLAGCVCAEWGKNGADDAAQHFRRAISYFQKACELLEDDPDNQFCWGAVLVDLAAAETDQAKGLLEEACARFEHAAECGSEDGEIYRIWGNALHQLGVRNSDNAKAYWQEAAEKYFEALDRNPKDSESMGDLANVLGDLARMRGSRTHVQTVQRLYAAALILKPDSPRVHYNLGTTLMELAAEESNPEEMLNNACAQFERACAIDSDFALAFNNWGKVLLDLWKHSGRTDDALLEQGTAKLAEAHRLAPEEPMYAENLGVAYMETAKLERANAMDMCQAACGQYAYAVRVAPERASAYHHWGIALLKQAGRVPGNGAEFWLACREKSRRAAELNPNEPRYHTNWGIACLELANIQQPGSPERMNYLHEARDVFERIERLARGGAAYNLACTYALLGDKQRCRRCLEVGEEAQTLTTRAEAMTDPDLEPVRDEAWFQAIRWKEQERDERDD